MFPASAPGRPGPPGARGPSEVGVWRTIARATSHMVNGTAPGANGLYYPSVGGMLLSGTGAAYPPNGVVRLDPDVLTHPVLDVNLRVVLTFAANGTAPSAVLTNAGLYPFTAGGAAGTSALTLGTLVTGSGIGSGVISAGELTSFPAGAISPPTTGTDSDTALYTFGANINTNPAANSFTAIIFSLEMRLV